jgi:hypothetical protein
MRKSPFIIVIFLTFVITATSQSLIGSWQLVKQTNCQEENTSGDAGKKAMDLKSTDDKIQPIVHFVDHLNVQETVPILNTRKNINSKHFLYKLDSATLYILDKRTRTIAETYNIDSWKEDSLILVHTTRPCETRVFIKVK